MKKMGGRDKGNKRLLCICIASSAFWQKERKKDDLSHLKLKSDCTLHRGIRGLITKAEISPSELRPLNRKGQICPLKIRKRQQQMRNSHRILQGCICVLKGSSSIFLNKTRPFITDRPRRENNSLSRLMEVKSEHDHERIWRLVSPSIDGLTF